MQVLRNKAIVLGVSETDRIATNLRKGVLEYCVLALLASREMYGLELADALVERELSASDGSLYPLLARMRDSGTVTTRWDSGAGTRPRKYYAITDEGRRQLASFVGIWQRVRHGVEELVKEVPDV